MTKKPRQKKRIKSGKGALWIVAIILMASAVARLAGGTGQAIANTVDDLMGDAESHADQGMSMADPMCKSDDEVGLILAAVLKRENAIEDQERKLAERAASLDFAEKTIRENLTALKQAEDSLAATIATAETASEDDLARLTAVYENMKPKDAALLFEEMAPEFAAGFIARMRPDSAAPVMTGLAPQTAYSISVILAGRNANVPTE